jgi:hypothetical protein
MVDKNEIMRKFVIGACSGPIEISFSHVADVIKTVNQSRATNGNIESIFKTSLSIYNSNGIRGFYTGFIPRLIGIIPMRAVFWGSMYSASSFYALNFNDTSLLKKAIFMGTICGISQSIVDTPIEVAKIYLIERVINNRKTLDNSNVISNFQKFMKGYLPTTLRNTGFAIIMSYGTNYSQKNKFNTWENFLLMGACGASASYLTHPLDSWKTFAQSNNNNNNKFNDFIKILQRSNNKSEVLRIIFKGAHTRALMAIINMSVGSAFMMYALKLLNSVN